MCDDEASAGEEAPKVQAAVAALDEQIRRFADQLTDAICALSEGLDRLEAELSEHRSEMDAIFATLPKGDDFEGRVDEIMSWMDALEG